jgi:Carboxypeptidase regulatory-like domain
MAQETSGALQGAVRYNDSNALAGATILAIHLPSGTQYTTTSSVTGHYYMPGLRIGGPYRIRVTYTGMETATRDSIIITLGEPVSVNLSLTDKAAQLGTVIVSAAAKRPPVANIYGAGQNFSRDQLRDMPTLNRSITDMTRQMPQISKDNYFEGSSYRYNNVTIDGAINNDAIGFSPSLGGQTGTSNMPGASTRTNPISLDAIEDMQVYLAPFDVTIGNFTGGSINAVTRSGTNFVTGSIYGYGGNSWITGPDNAGGQGAMPKAYHTLQTGFRVGFPLIKDKLFFFTNEEITRRTDPVQQVAGSGPEVGVLTLADAQNIRDTMISRYGAKEDPGTFGQYNIYSNSNKFFNRLDWNISPRSQLILRNNTVTSQAINLERDQEDFRFGSIAYQQVNNQSSTVGELKSRFAGVWFNDLIAGYTSIHDYRNPFSDPAFPQVEIVGETPGTTIFFGTDREGSIFNMRQKTFELTDNLSWNLGRHHLLLGTHNEFYSIDYGFVNSWNGRVSYPSIEDFLANNPNRVRGSYNYENNTRDYILAHPVAVFHVNFYSAYLQDELQITDRFKVTTGLRADYSIVPTKQILSNKTTGALTDPFFGTTYDYTPMNEITGNYLSRVQVSPRLGFNWDLKGDRSLVIRGGTGVFTGRIPFAWLGYAFYNNGNTFGAYDENTSAGTVAFAPGTDPLRFNSQQGIAPFAQANGQVVNNAQAGKSQADLVDNHFVMPQVWRTSVAVDYKGPGGINYSFEGVYTQVIEDVKFQQINLSDNPSYYVYDTASNLKKQPIYPSGGVNPYYANAYEMSNTSLGFRYSLTAKLTKRLISGWDLMAAYTYGQSKDIANGVRNSMESNWQLNQALVPNDPHLAWSNFDTRHRIIANIGYRVIWAKNLVSRFSVFFNSQSGSPYTYGFVNYTVQNTPQQVSLAYIPNQGEAVNFFQTYTDASHNVVTAKSQADAFNAFIDHDKYLSSRRGTFTERNGARTPWNTTADFHFSQDIGVGRRSNQVITLSWDIVNVTNLLDKDWGHLFFSPNTYNSTASVGLVPYIPAQTSQGYPVFKYQDPGKPYSVDFMNSRWQMQMGVRYSF